uniref:protein LYK5-like n=1 Tax=Erigeron canadensis TaxID=72917 RepID=UPI001CB8A00A|nr:protein LYK5-like [Erigeron canadensis]
MSSNPSELARINNVSKTTVFPHDKEVIIPVNCSCFNQYYQAITRYRIKPQAETYFVVANLTFQGLSTCGSIKHANHYNEFKLEYGFELRVPLRCACPTNDQISNSTKYLLTYPVSFGDSIDNIASRFNVASKSVLNANGMARTSPFYPFTTLVIPLPTEPSISDRIIQRARPTIPVSLVKRSTSKKLLIFGIAAVCSLLVLTLVITVLGLVYAKIKQNKQATEVTEKEMLPEDLLVEIASFERVIKVFSFKELKKSTANFANKHKIKGSVYRGTFGNKTVAVKKIEFDVHKQVNMLSKINHINLLKLYGFCTHKDSWYLVFEYMTMGSLKGWLRRERSEGSHSLCRRVQIAVDVAYGLQYLHNFTKPGYVHGNIKSSNILLDANLRAKISNFSLSSTMGNDREDRVFDLSTMIVGTRGYMAPEYVGNGNITMKVDVYSFGVVMLELITGKYAVVRQGSHEVLLTTAIATIMKGEDAENEIRKMVDLKNEETRSIEYAVQMVKLSLNCVKEDPVSRPSMDEVVSSMVRILVDLKTIIDPLKDHRL